jgi:hypothetical protein
MGRRLSCFLVSLEEAFIVQPKHDRLATGHAFKNLFVCGTRIPE